MTHSFLQHAALAILVAHIPTWVLGQDGARSILVRMDSLHSLVQYESAVIEMRLFEGNSMVRRRALDLKTAKTDGVQKALAVFIEPPDIRGMSLLTIETESGTDQRLYLPAIRRVQRITGSRRSERFAGSDFSFEDLRTRDPDDYESSIIERRPGRWVLSLIPRDDESPYSRIEAVVDSTRMVFTRARYFDREGRLRKVLTSSEFSKLREGVWEPGIMVMEDVQENRRTELEYRTRETGNIIPAETFTERQMRRGS